MKAVRAWVDLAERIRLIEAKRRLKAAFKRKPRPVRVIPPKEIP